MDPVTLIVTALAQGAASALKDSASSAVKEAYAGLRDAVRKRLAIRQGAELVLAHYETAPQTWQAPLASELSEAGAADDAGLTAAAQALMQLLDVEGSRSGKYTVTVSSSQGFQVGDHNALNITIGPGSA